MNFFLQFRELLQSGKSLQNENIIINLPIKITLKTGKLIKTNLAHTHSRK